MKYEFHDNELLLLELGARSTSSTGVSQNPKNGDRYEYAKGRPIFEVRDSNKDQVISSRWHHVYYTTLASGSVEYHPM